MYVTYSEPPFDEEVDHVLLVVIAVRQVEPVHDDRMRFYDEVAQNVIICKCVG